MMWQNGGMSGLDQWNFVMHPIDAAFTCDPKGDFVRKFGQLLRNRFLSIAMDSIIDRENIKFCSSRMYGRAVK